MTDIGDSHTVHNRVAALVGIHPGSKLGFELRRRHLTNTRGFTSRTRHLTSRAMPVLRSERRASIERSSPYRRPRAAGVPSTPPAARTSAVAPSTRAGTGAGTGARELVERFVQWQQPHAWKQLEGVERLWATSDLHVEHESNLAFLSGLDGYSEDGLIVAGDVCQHGQKRPHVGFFSWPTRPSRRLRPAAALPT